MLAKRKIERQFSGGYNQPIFFPVANYLTLSKLKLALGFEKVKVFAYGAAPIKQSTIKFYTSIGIPLFNFYGMSETSGPQSVNISKSDTNFLSAGKPLIGTQLKIENPDEFGVGEICFRGRNRFMGYFGSKQLTHETIDSRGFLHSGDLGRIDADGNLFISGRLKEIIVTAGGENIAPLPIENTILSLCPVM